MTLLMTYDLQCTEYGVYDVSVAITKNLFVVIIVTIPVWSTTSRVETIIDAYIHNLMKLNMLRLLAFLSASVTMASGQVR